MGGERGRGGFGGGSGGAGGYHYQALAAAYIGAHALARHPLNWVEASGAVPLAVWAETGGAGDDLRVEFVSEADLEIQAKKGQRKNAKLWQALLRLARGLKEDSSLRCMLLVDTSASETVREKLALDVRRLGQGRSDRLRPVGEELLGLLSGEDIEPERRLMERLSIVTADLSDRSTGEGLALVLLARAVEKAKILSAWDALRQDGMRLAEEGGRSDLRTWWRLLGDRNIGATDPDTLATLEGRQREDHVPPRPRPFLGRDAVIEEVSQTLARADEDPPIIALHGLPGAGKTTVAAAVAERLRPSFPGGVLWASLGESPDPLTAFAVWGRVVGAEDVAGYSDVGAASARMRAALRERRVLIVLDDVWETVHAVPFDVGGLGSATLATTRFRPVALGVAGAGGARDLGVLAAGDAIRLLEELAPSLGEEDRGTLAGLAEDLGRLPVLLRIAGRLIEERAGLGLRVAGLISELAQGRELLQAEVPPDLAGLSGTDTLTVAALLARSTNTLTGEEQGRFARLAAFARGPTTFDLAAVREVWGAAGNEETENALAALARRDLIRPEGSGRFSVHPVLFMQADAMLRRTSEAGRGARVSHASHYLDVLRSAGRLYSAGGEGRRVGSALFDAEWENVRAGRAWAASFVHGTRGASDPARWELAGLVLAYAEAGGQWVSRRASLSERGVWAEDAIEAARLLEEAAARAGEPDVPEDRSARRYRAARAHQIYVLAQARSGTGDPDGALELLEESAEIYRLLGDRRGRGRSVGLCGVIRQRKGEFGRAEELFRTALTLLEEAAADTRAAREAGAEADPEEERQVVRDRAMVLGNFGSLLKNMGRKEEAEAAITEAIDAFREIGDTGQAAIALDNLGALRSELFGDRRGALRAFGMARRIFRGLGWRHDEAVALLGLGRERANAGEHAAADEAARELLVLGEDLGDLLGQGWSLALLGSARLGLEDPAGAAEAHMGALELSRTTHDDRLGIVAKMGLGRAALAEGNPAGALRHFEEGLATARDIPVPLLVGQLLFDEAQALNALGRREEAIAAARNAVTSREELGAPEVAGAKAWLEERVETGHGG